MKHIIHMAEPCKIFMSFTKHICAHLSRLPATEVSRFALAQGRHRFRNKPARL